LRAEPSATEAEESYSVAESAPEAVSPAHAAAPSAQSDDDSIDGGTTMELTQVTDIDVDTIEERVPVGDDGPDTVLMVNLAGEANEGGGTALDYNLSDLDGNAQHLEMPGSLQDRPVFVERRKNVVDTLMAALQRDPTRNDLRLKLLETLYTTAATNLRAFKEVARDLARHPERLKAEEWQQVQSMGRHLAAEDDLFADPAVDDKVA
jgi:hypothetical protein